jgi:hypothetical protein
MPTPLPPLPPQPSVEETARAVAWVRWSALVALAMYLLVSSFSHLDAPLVAVGRHHGSSWLRWRATHLDPLLLRDHPGGKIAWLVGASILRESFDEALINEALAARGSEWRVVKFGMSRGAAGVVAGLLDDLPIQEGDRVLHAPSISNLHRDWLDWTDLPEDRLHQLYSVGELWQIEEWTLQQKLEASLSWPRGYHAHRYEMMEGLYLFLFEAPYYLWVPPARRWSRQLTVHPEAWADRQKAPRMPGPGERGYLDAADLDLSPGQFNLAGMSAMARHCEARGATFTLVDIPHAAAYQRKAISPAAREQWDRWRAETASLVYAPQLQDNQLYDARHPDAQGRLVLSHWLLHWLGEGGPRGIPTPIDDEPHPSVQDAP